MADPQSKTPSESLLDRLRHALSHAEQAVRCYAALAEKKAQAMGRRMVRRVAAVAVLAFCLLVGGIYVLNGVAALVESWLHRRLPGGGSLLVGIFLIAAGLATFLIVFRKDEGGGEP